MFSSSSYGVRAFLCQSLISAFKENIFQFPCILMQAKKSKYFGLKSKTPRDWPLTDLANDLSRGNSDTGISAHAGLCQPTLHRTRLSVLSLTAACEC